MSLKKIENIFIVGNRGAMGSFFEKKLRCHGKLDIKGMDMPACYDRVKSELSKAHMVLLCVPVGAIEEVVKQIKDRVSEKCIMVDICSVKVVPLNSMLQQYKGPVVGTHPLFGPKPGHGTPLKVVMTRGRGDREFFMVKKVFEEIGCTTFESTPHEHDRAMAFIQGLNFVTTLSYFASFSGDESLITFITPSFKRRLDSAKKMLTEDASLFQTLFEANPYSYDAVKRFRSFLNLASAGDLDLLIQKSWWWLKKEYSGGDGG